MRKNIWGIRVSDIKKINPDKVYSFLEELDRLNYMYLYDYQESKGDNENYTIAEWLENFSYDGCTGVAAFLKEVIDEIENINVSSANVQGVQYIGIIPDLPWYFNEKTKSMTYRDFVTVLNKYVDKVTDTRLVYDWYDIGNDY